MDEKTKAQIQQEAADLVAKLQPRSGKFRTISPEMDPLRLGSGWTIEDLDKPQVTAPVTSAPISATARPRATTALTTRCPVAT